MSRLTRSPTCVALLLAFAVTPSGAQSTPPRESPGASSRWAIAGTLLLATASLDTRIRAAAAGEHSWTLDRLAGTVDPFGRAKYLVPSLVATSLLPRAFGQTPLANRALRIGLGYATADAVESLLKPAVGRHRPSDGGGAWRFRPLAGEDAWHSFPSAHTVHAFSIAVGLANETRSSWAHLAGFTVAALVAMQRVYRQDHWSSDVVGSGMLATIVSSGTVHWVRRHGAGPLVPPVDSGQGRNAGPAFR